MRHWAAPCWGGPSTDFNVMARRGQWLAQLAVLDGAADAGRGTAGLCLVLQGGWLAGGEVLSPGQGLWWSARPPAAVPLVPLNPQGGDARLAQVLLRPA